MNRYDVVIVGGGAAGLSAALVLARACRKVAVVNAGTPRNSASPGVHGFLSREGTLPAELKKISRKQILRYPDIDFADQCARRIRSAEQGFEVALNGGDTLNTNAVILAVGMIDELPDIPGFEQYWGRQVIHCPFCHGWENRGTQWGVLAKDLADVEAARNYRYWTDTLTVFTDERVHIPDEVLQKLARNNIALDRRPVSSLVSSSDGDLCAVELDDGSQVPCDTIVYRTVQQQTGIVIDSGVALSENGRVWIDETYETSIPGIFAAGDLVPGPQDVLSAASHGAMAAKGTLGLL